MLWFTLTENPQDSVTSTTPIALTAYPGRLSRFFPALIPSLPRPLQPIPWCSLSLCFLGCTFCTGAHYNGPWLPRCRLSGARDSSGSTHLPALREELCYSGLFAASVHRRRSGLFLMSDALAFVQHRFSTNGFIGFQWILKPSTSRYINFARKFIGLESLLRNALGILTTWGEKDNSHQYVFAHSFKSSLLYLKCTPIWATKVTFFTHLYFLD